MKKSRIRRAKLSFNLETAQSNVHLGAVGINLPPTMLNLEGFRKASVESYGSLFGSMNNSHYYEGATAENVVPKPEDFISAPFRLLSATIVGGGSWKATDFRNEAVLKKSLHLLQNKPLYKDHETDLDNWVGLVGETKWSASRDQNGLNIPSGIDGIVLIDAKTNPKIARGVLMGSVFSNSVTVDFEWKPSHQFETEDEFYMNLGKIASDGKMVTRVVTKIHDYFESSLVWLGADPFAKAIDAEGQLINVDESNVYEYAKASFSKTHNIDLDKAEDEPNKEEKTLRIDFALDKNVISLRQNLEDNKKSNSMNKFWLAFVALYGAQLNLKDEDNVESFSDERINELLGQLSLKQTEEEEEVAKLQSYNNIYDGILKFVQKDKPEANSVDIAEFMKTHTFVGNDALADMQNQITSLSADAKVGQAYNSRRIEEAIRLYKASVDTPDESVIELFRKADSSAVDGLLAQYTKKATEKFSGSCASCGSHDFTFQSSMIIEEDDTESAQEVHAYTANDFRAEFGNNNKLFND